MSQHIATRWPIRTQHVAINSVALACCDRLAVTCEYSRLSFPPTTTNERRLYSQASLAVASYADALWAHHGGGILRDEPKERLRRRRRSLVGADLVTNLCKQFIFANS